ncbi:MAG: ABC transporter ATP-binding protein [Desulfobacterales bacterium]
MRKKLKHIIRLDRAVRFVWQAGAGWVIGSAAVMTLQGVLPLAALYLMKRIVDAVTEAVKAPEPAAAFGPVLFFIVLAGGVALLQASLGAVSGLIQEAMSLTVSDRMYQRLHAKSIEVDLDYYENPQYFDTLHRAQREGPNRPTQIVNTLMRLGQNSISLIAMAGLLFTFHWAVALVLVAAAAPGIFVRMRYSKVMFHWQRAKTPDERKAMYYNRILTGNAHAKEVRLFGIGDEISDRFTRVRDRLRKEKLAISRKRVFADFMAQAVGSLAVFATFGAIAYRAVMGAITLGDMVMFYQAFQRGLGYLRTMLRGVADLYDSNLFLSYLYEFLDFTPRVQEPEDPLPVPQTPDHGLRFENVWFRYPNTAPMVLKDVSLAVRPGEVVALVGENGSGKTTLAKLLCRLYDPTEGRIFLENISLDRFSTAALRREISVIFQDFAKYNLSAADNIRFGNIDLSDTDNAAIERAAKDAGADHIIETLPHQYQTILGKLFKDGVELSIGQWQMIALARAFLRDGRLIVLDEPTSSLDPKTEYQIFNRFRELLHNKSAILISHRFSTVQMADRILVLHKGRIVEEGPHAALIQKNGYYAELFSNSGGHGGLVF